MKTNYNITWDRFLINDIFDTVNSKAYHKTNLTESKSLGGIPYISRTNCDNGVECLVLEDEKFIFNQANSISFGAENATFFFQPYRFVTGNKMYVIKHKNLSRHTGLFLQTALNKSIQGCGFGYGKGLTGTRLKKRFILLPVTKKGTPDWYYMESYMKKIEKEILSDAISYMAQKVSENIIVSPPPSTTYKEFYFSEVFDEIQRGKRLKKSHHTIGDIPYVSSTANNNGIDGFISNKSNVRKFHNCISLANSGSVGSVFFHCYEFIASDHITKLQRNGIDKYSYLYMLPIINRLSEKYSFNREINDTRIRRERMLLPTNTKGDIDFCYMSSFMRNIENGNLTESIDYFSNLLKANDSPPPDENQVFCD